MSVAPHLARRGLVAVFGSTFLEPVGPQRDLALWLVLGLTAAGLVWSFGIPALPASDDAHSTP